MGKSIARWERQTDWGGRALATPALIGTMSFRLAIPWQVALPQSPPPLHQPGRMVQHKRANVQSKSSEWRIVSYLRVSLKGTTPIPHFVRNDKINYFFRSLSYKNRRIYFTSSRLISP